MFRDDESYARRLLAIGRTRMHRHPGVVEIVLVLRGSLHITVSSEQFNLVAGDYAVLNAGDPHLLIGSDDNVTALVHAKLANFAGEVPGIDGVIFACESFDLPRSRGQEDELRRQLLGVLQTSGHACRARLAGLLTELCDGFAYEDYYERRQQLSIAKRVQFREIVMAMRAALAERDVLERVAESQHYHKNSLSRIVRDATAVSFSDLLTYLRVAAAEVALIDTDATVSQIAADCGFSDAKYLTRAFRAWFGERPADYRRRVRPLTVHDERVIEAGAAGEQLLEALRLSPMAPPAPPRLSVTPLLVKNLGRSTDLFRAVTDAEILAQAELPASSPVPRTPHLLPIRVPLDGSSALGWGDLLRGVDRERFQPVLVLPVGDVATLEQVVAQVAEIDVPTPAYWISYEAGTAESAQRLADELHARCGVDAVPIAAG